MIKTFKELLFQSLEDNGNNISQKKQNKEIDKNQLRVGILVQKQHTYNQDIAKKIAMDHLKQHQNYYTILINAGLVDEEKALVLAKQLGVI